VQFDTHVCLVSAQPTPNITPVADAQTRPKRVILVVSNDMQSQAEWLGNVIKQRGVRVEGWPIVDPWDVEHLQSRLMELLEREQEGVAGKTLALNATGGTKPMSIAAYETFRAYDLPIFYVHPEQDRLIWMYPQNGPALVLEDTIKLGPFLAAHGATAREPIERTPPAPEVIDFAEELVKDLDRYAKALPVLNALAASARNRRESARLDRNDPGSSLDELIERFADAGYVVRQDSVLRFPDEAHRAFVNGGWFEQYVFHRVKRLHAEDVPVQDAACNLTVERTVRRKPVTNELDVALLVRNKLYVIECKTRSWPENPDGSSGADALYKLDSLVDLVGGLKARGMLVSYLPLPDKDKRRAADLRIEVCEGREVAELSSRLAKWVR